MTRMSRTPQSLSDRNYRESNMPGDTSDNPPEECTASEAEAKAAKLSEMTLDALHRAIRAEDAEHDRLVAELDAGRRVLADAAEERERLLVRLQRLQREEAARRRNRR